MLQLPEGEHCFHLNLKKTFFETGLNGSCVSICLCPNFYIPSPGVCMRAASHQTYTQSLMCFPMSLAHYRLDRYSIFTRNLKTRLTHSTTNPILVFTVNKLGYPYNLSTQSKFVPDSMEIFPLHIPIMFDPSVAYHQSLPTGRFDLEVTVCYSASIGLYRCVILYKFVRDCHTH